ncbi:MAG: hypothetical protein ABSD44_04220 [Terracidiphilus sp.]
MIGDLWKECYPTLTGDELQIARETLDAYLELAWEIYEEVREQEQAGLTEAASSSTIQGKVDSSKN